MVETVEAILRIQKSKNNLLTNDPLTNENEPLKIIVHCWRGGMRSAGVAWLLDLYGYKVYTIIGGYKAYRGWVRQQFEINYDINILGGYTGSAKTKLLHKLASKGQNTIDLEGLASHKGSAFGKIGMATQPSQEMFENLLANSLFEVSSKLLTENAHIWLEDESQRIGNVMLPDGIWKQMRTCPVFFLNIPFEERLNYLVQDYSNGQTEEFVNGIIRIQKRLGGLEAKTAINYLLEGNIKEAFRVLLTYYDKYYKKGLFSRENIGALLVEMPFDTVLSPLQSIELIAVSNAKKEAISTIETTSIL